MWNFNSIKTATKTQIIFFEEWFIEKFYNLIIVVSPQMKLDRQYSWKGLVLDQGLLTFFAPWTPKGKINLHGSVTSTHQIATSDMQTSRT